MTGNPQKRAAFRAAFITTTPVLLGYLSLGVALGVFAAKNGIPPFFAALMSFLMYSGALGFAAVGFISAGMNIPQMALMGLLINIRHIFFGIPLFEKFKGNPLKWYMVFALTDESYVLLVSNNAPPDCDKNSYYFFITLLDHFYFTVATPLGGVLGVLIPFDMTGLEFSLNALFVVLLVDQVRAAKSRIPLIIGAVCIVTAPLVFRSFDPLIIALGAAMALLLCFRGRIESNE